MDVRGPGVIAIVGGWGLAALGGCLGYKLLVERGRLLLRIEGLEQRLAQAGTAPSLEDVRAQGLPVGAPAPDVQLPDLSGRQRTLSEWQGERILLIFFDAACDYCRQMVPDLARLTNRAGRPGPRPVIIAGGDSAAIRYLMAEYGVAGPILLQDASAVSAVFHVQATPAAYVVDARGAIASALALGTREVLALRGDAGDGTGRSGDAAGAAAHDGVGAGSAAPTVSRRPLAESRINRSGLTAGTPAPPFSVPDLDGGHIALDDWRGRRVLLVFSDPSCAPCDALAPELERLHRRSTDPAVLMISRGDREANRAKAREHGLTFPIGLQRHWEVSRAYGIFATPIGYLVDERGILLADVAVGADAILALADRHVGRRSEQSGKEVRMRA